MQLSGRRPRCPHTASERWYARYLADKRERRRMMGILHGARRRRVIEELEEQ